MSRSKWVYFFCFVTHGANFNRHVPTAINPMLKPDIAILTTKMMTDFILLGKP